MEFQVLVMLTPPVVWELVRLGRKLGTLGGRLGVFRRAVFSHLHPLQKHSPCWQGVFGLRVVSLSSAGSIQAEQQPTMQNHVSEQTKKDKSQ